MTNNAMLPIVAVVLSSFLLVGLTFASDLRFRDRCFSALAREVPRVLHSQDRESGRFGSGIWIVNDQNVIFPLAVAWAFEHPRNPYHRSDQVLQAVMAGGDALIEDQDAQGQWEFRKKDGSTWGKIFMPWTYSRWIRAYGLIRHATPSDRRQRWEAALRLGCDGIAKHALGHVHNIPAHHAMGLYIASQLLDRPDWRQQAAAFMARVLAAQNPDGYWSEHAGPVVRYNFVYLEALGIYFGVSGDNSVLPALRRAASFHANFTYPDGSLVETIDERNPYHHGVPLGNVGLCMTDIGRALLQRRFALLKDDAISADAAASFLLYGQEGTCADELPQQDRDFVLGNNDAAVRRRGPWFLCASAFVCPVSDSRWIQDRQNLVSAFHDAVGLIIGGGNSKLQPGWSSFTVGDTRLLRHEPSDEDPDFQPSEGLQHVPTAAKLAPGEEFGLDLHYGSQRCQVRLEIGDANSLACIYRAIGPYERQVTAHVTVLPRFNEIIRSESGRSATVGEAGFHWKAGQAGAWIEHAGVRITLPPAADVRWPVLPHNPYRKDGCALPPEGRIVIDLPFSRKGGEHHLVLSVR